MLGKTNSFLWLYSQSLNIICQKEKKQQPRINNKKNENKTTITQNHAIVYWNYSKLYVHANQLGIPLLFCWHMVLHSNGKISTVNYAQVILEPILT